MDRLHVQKVHVIEFAPQEFFTHGMKEAVNDMLTSLDGAWYNDDDYPSASDEIEVDADTFKTFIEDLENMTDEEFNDEFGKPHSDPNNEWSREFVIKCFKGMYECRDTRNDFINISWF